MKHRTSIHSERGIAAVVGILIFLLLAVLVVIGVVVGLDHAVVSSGGKSMLSSESKLKPIVENIREKKRALASKLEQGSDGATAEGADSAHRESEFGDEGSYANEGGSELPGGSAATDDSRSTDDRLGDVAKRLERNPD